jgi:glutamine synthetase
MLPKSLADALRLFEQEPLFRNELGDVFVDYYLGIKRTELKRFEAYLQQHELDQASDQTTEWEQNEYFDFF